MRCGRPLVVLVALALAGGATARPATARVLAPSAVVRRFCEADGRGDRLHPRRWSAVAPLVTWQLEPAWDRVRLISGYQILPERVTADPSVQGDEPPRVQIELDVAFSVVADVTADGNSEAEAVDRVTFTLRGDDRSGWRMVGPPPYPHVFASGADPTEIQQSLAPNATAYVSASAFVYQMLKDAGWNVPYVAVNKLRESSAYRTVQHAAAGDLVVYLNGETPYHVGLFMVGEQVASATANAGITQTVLDAFAGTIEYRRLVAPRPTPVPSPPATKAKKRAKPRRRR